MTAPAITARVAPVGIDLEDGYQSFIAFALDPDISLWEVSLTPPGRESSMIDQTTMHNVDYETQSVHHLKKVTDITGKAGYDPAVKDQIDAIIGVNGSITFHYPDGSTESIWGALMSATHDEHAKKTKPMINFTIVCTNRDTDRNEAGPVIVSVPGT